MTKQRILYNICMTICRSYVSVERINSDNSKFIIGAYTTLSEAKDKILKDFYYSFNKDNYQCYICCNEETYNDLSYTIKDISYEELTANE